MVILASRMEECYIVISLTRIVLILVELTGECYLFVILAGDSKYSNYYEEDFIY